MDFNQAGPMRVDFAWRPIESHETTGGASGMAQREVPEACAKWLADVDRIMKRDWYIDTNDAGLDDEQVVAYWKFGETPEEFVAWFAEDADLYDFRTPWARIKG